MKYAIITGLGIFVWLVFGSAAFATPKLGDDCKACHTSNNFLPVAHPPIANMTSQMCKTCHLATSSQDQTQTRQTSRDQVRDQDREQQRDQDRTQLRRQVRLGGDPGASPLRTQPAVGSAAASQEIERYLERETQAEGGADGGDHRAQSHEFHHDQTRMQEGTDAWRTRFLFGYLYSSDIEQHISGSHFGSSGGSDHSDGHHDTPGEDLGDGPDGSFLRLGARADYTTYLGYNRTATYNFALNHDTFFELDQVRYVGRAGVDWKWKLGDGTLKLSPYLQRSFYKVDDEKDRAFWALGLNANRHVALTPVSTISYTFRFKQRRFDGEDATRRPDVRVGVVYQNDFRENWRYRLGFGLLDRNNPKREDRRYFGQIATAGVGGKLQSGGIGWLTFEVGHRSYDAPDRTAGIRRDDSFVGLGASYTDDRIKIWGAAPKFSCKVRRTKSNIDEFETTSHYCAAFVEKRF